MGRNEFLDRHDTITCTVHKALYRRTNDVHLINDVCQNVLIICWKKDSELRELPPEQFERFVVRVTMNQYCSWMRKRKMLKWPEGSEEGSSADDPAVTIERTEQSLFLLSLLNGLPPHYREITRLHIVEGWTHERIAGEKDVPVSTVKTQFRRAKALVKDAITRYFLPLGCSV
jgi:RNA polymerase sigma factor (sigma-70 family)